MFNAVIVGIISLIGWGMIGIWTQTFGYHHVWESCVYQNLYGLLVCPWYFYSQILISEVTTRGKGFHFFSLLSIIGKMSTSSGHWSRVGLLMLVRMAMTAFYLTLCLGCKSAPAGSRWPARPIKRPFHPGSLVHISHLSGSNQPLGRHE